MHVTPLGPLDPNTSQAFSTGLEINQGNPRTHWQQFKLLENFKKKSPSAFIADTLTIYQHTSKETSSFTTILPHPIEAEDITFQEIVISTQSNSSTSKTVMFGAPLPAQ